MAKSHLEQLVEHGKKYKGVPIDKISNFYLKRPLTEYEMECVRLTAICDARNNSEYKNIMRSLVLVGNISSIVNSCEHDYACGYHDVYTTNYVTDTHINSMGRIEQDECMVVPGMVYSVPFPPTKTSWGETVVLQHFVNRGK